MGGLRRQLVLMVVAAIVPMAAALVVAAALAPPAWGAAGLLAAGLGASAGLAGLVAARRVLGPIARLRALVADGAAAPVQDDIGDLAPGDIGDLAKALQRVTRAADTATLARLEAETALHHSTDVMGSLIAALPVGVLTIGRAGRIELWNRAAEEILGYRAEELSGRPLPTQVFSSPVKQGVAAADVYLRMVTGQTIKGEEVRCRRKDGSFVEASFSGVALMDEDQRLRCAICVFDDVSQRNAVARQLHQAQKMEAVGQLTGGLAHDFNNILGVAIGNLDLLEGQVDDRPEVCDLIEIALGALLRGAELTRALLAFSRCQPLQPAQIDAAQLLAVATRMLSRVLGEHIQIVFQAAADLHPVVVDAAQLEATITNLAINARDAMPDGGRLTVSARDVQLDGDDGEVEAGCYLLIEISDTGTGMPPEVLARVFEPFFTTKPVGQGTGLGLSMVYGFIKQSGGHIKIYSEVGHGTTIRLYLPQAAEPPPAPSVASPPGELRGGTETVLVVDDNRDVRRMVEGQLIRLGYRVIPAEHGPAALAVLRSEVPVDLLFTDVVMPEGMNGFDLAEAALALRPGLAVLFTSGFPGTALRRPDGLKGTVDFLSKPYRRHDLARIVRDILDAKGNKS